MRDVCGGSLLVCLSRATGDGVIVSPLTGEVLADELETLVSMERRVDSFLRHLSPHYEFRRELRERIAELRGPAELPRARWRSDRQSRVAACPRCGERSAA